jgi:NarL family two-component system response regulator LiaR
VVRLLVVDENDLYRIGLATLLDVEPDLEIVAQASGGRMAVRLAAELRPDVALIGLVLPDLDGYEAIRMVLGERPATRIVALAPSDDGDAVDRAIRAGACSFVLTQTPVDDIVAAIRGASRGATWLAPAAADLVLGRLRHANGRLPSADRLETLSSRESEVLGLLTAGLGNAEIAEALKVAPRTVRNHISNILQKLAVENRVQAAVCAARAGLG